MKDTNIFEDRELRSLDWDSFAPVEELLRAVGLTPSETEMFRGPYESFRRPKQDEPLRLTDDVRTSEQWFDLLFSDCDGKTYKSETDPDITYYGKMSEGYSRQINLDNIGRDFLCMIYYRQRIIDLMREGGLSLVLRDLFKADEREPVEYTNLNNSLIPVEALRDYLLLNGYDLTDDLTDRRTFVVLTDPPQNLLSLREYPNPIRLIRDTANLSGFIRDLSVCVQELGKWDDLIQVLRDWDLPENFSLLRRIRTSRSTTYFAMTTALSREFCLWDIYRGHKLPSIRAISEETKIPYIELLRAVRFGYSNRETGLNRFEGTQFLRKGLTEKFVIYFENSINERRTGNE